jgi:hypothetical protein
MADRGGQDPGGAGGSRHGEVGVGRIERGRQPTIGFWS